MNPAQFMTRTAAPAAGLATEAAQLEPWFHNVHLPDGTETAPAHPLGDFPSYKWREIAAHLPADLTGWTALDIGCNSGFYSVELARRGAHVVAIDRDPHFLKQARWIIDRFDLGHRIDLQQAQVYDLAHWETSFDLILFMGVFYHLRHPLLALDLVAEKTRRLLVFQTLTLPGDAVVTPPDDLDFNQRDAMHAPGWPTMAFIEKSLAGDPTNWWAPNHACIEAMLRTAGLRVSARPGHEAYLCTPQPRADALTALNREELLAATGRSTLSKVSYNV
jgi:2-polyprenyl-3-methyl-5-hydroxy-6-metoxy-1,4-benzoquinol methylase